MSTYSMTYPSPIPYPKPASAPAQMVFPQFQCTAPAVSSPSPLHQWPWRGLAFASDLGTVGALVKQPVLGFVGWALALPYYAYAILSKPRGQKRKEEAIYQVTTNGIFPLLEAKLGILAGGALERKLKAIYPSGVLSRIQSPVYKISGGLLALLAMTPTVGDPMSQRVMVQYRSSRKGAQI